MSYISNFIELVCQKLNIYKKEDVHGNFKPGANDSMELKKHTLELTNTQSKCRVMEDHIPIRQCCNED